MIREIGKFFAKVRNSLERDRGISGRERIRKGGRYMLGTALAPFYLRRCDRVGVRGRTIGRPLIINEGVVELGDDFVINSEFGPVEIAARGSGTIRIGDRAVINYGTAITSTARLTIGNDVTIGPYSIVGDDDRTFEDQLDSSIEIGDGVWLAGRVTVLPGARIGKGAVISAGSIVSGEIPPRVVARGIPARPIRSVDARRGEGAGTPPVLNGARSGTESTRADK